MLYFTKFIKYKRVSRKQEVFGVLLSFDYLNHAVCPRLSLFSNKAESAYVNSMRLVRQRATAQ